jgi:PAS domain S-box-containing protein
LAAVLAVFTTELAVLWAGPLVGPLGAVPAALLHGAAICAVLLPVLALLLRRSATAKARPPQSDGRLRELVELGPDSIVTLDRWGRITSCNAATERITGFAREELLGKRFTKLGTLRAQDARKYVRLFGSILRGRIPPPVELQIVCRDGTLRTVESRVATRRKSGEPAGVVVISRDVTERRRAEEARRRNEQELRLVAENIPALLSYVGANGRYRFVNRRYEEWFGLSPQDVIGRHYSEVLGDGTQQLIRERVRSALSGRHVHYEDALPYRCGGTRWVSAEYVPDVDESGQVLGFFALVTDITERKRVEEALRQAEIERRAILDAQPQTVVLHDRDLTIRWPNRAACELAGASREALIGRHCYEVWQRRPTPCDDCPVLEALRTGRDCARVCTTPDERVWRIVGSPVRNDAGETVSVIEVAEDITHQRQMEEQLWQSQKMDALGRLAAGISHDFRNQLMVIQWSAQRLLERRQVDSDARGEIREILKALEQSRQLTERLLAFSRREALHPRRTDLNAALSDMAGSLRAAIGEGIALSLRPAEQPAVVDLDPNQFQQAVLNLAVNAREAMPDGGELTITVDRVAVDAPAAKAEGVAAGPYVSVCVADTGAGMDAETRRRAFEPFFTSREGKNGTGLGLATVYGLVKHSGGFVRLRSAPGRGSTFRLHLPLVNRPPESARVPEGSADGHGQTAPSSS